MFFSFFFSYVFFFFGGGGEVLFFFFYRLQKQCPYLCVDQSKENARAVKRKVWSEGEMESETGERREKYDFSMSRLTWEARALRTLKNRFWKTPAVLQSNFYSAKLILLACATQWIVSCKYNFFHDLFVDASYVNDGVLRKPPHSCPNYCMWCNAGMTEWLSK